MSKIKIFKKKVGDPIHEEESQDNAQTQAPAVPNPEAVKLYNDIAQIDKQIADEEKACADKINNLKQNKVQLQKQLADLGAGTNESASEDFVNKVNESYDKDSDKFSSISELINQAIDNADVSYTFSKKECDNFTRYVLEKMSEDDSDRWDKKVDNSDKFLDILMKYKKITDKFGSSEKEMTKLRESFRKTFSAGDNVYSWIFGE